MNDNPLVAADSSYILGNVLLSPEQQARLDQILVGYQGRIAQQKAIIEQQKERILELQRHSSGKW